MTNLTNFNRDMSWIDPVVAARPWSAAGVNLVNTDGNVYDKHAYARCLTNAQTEASTLGFGLLMSAPIDEPVPFRVKSDASVIGTGSLTIGLGYVQTPAVGDNTMVDVNIFGFPGGIFYDDVWCVRPNVARAGYAMAVFVGLTGSSAASVACKLTVQRLIGKPDNFAGAIA